MLFHAREAFTSSTDRIIAELRCIIWAMHSPSDLHLPDISIAFDSQATFEAFSKPTEWPRYRILLNLINILRFEFGSWSLELEQPGSNYVAREISKSVTRDGLYQFYLPLGGPA